MILRRIVTQENTILHFYSQHMHRCYRQFQYFQTRVSRMRNWLTDFLFIFYDGKIRKPNQSANEIAERNST